MLGKLRKDAGVAGQNLQPITEMPVKLKKDVGAAGQSLQPIPERLGTPSQWTALRLEHCNSPIQGWERL